MAKFESVLPTGARYVDGDERDEYVDRAAKITAVHHEPKAKFGPRWVIDAAMLDSGEIVAFTFAANPTRDTMFSNLAAGLDADGADAWEPVCLYMAEREGGHPYWTFRSATADEIAEAEAAEPITEAPGTDEATEAGLVPDVDAEPAPKAKAGK